MKWLSVSFPWLRACVCCRSRKQQLLDRARDFLSEDGMRFAVGLAAIKHQHAGTDNRRHTLELCQVRVAVFFRFSDDSTSLDEIECIGFV